MIEVTDTGMKMMGTPHSLLLEWTMITEALHGALSKEFDVEEANLLLTKGLFAAVAPNSNTEEEV